MNQTILLAALTAIIGSAHPAAAQENDFLPAAEDSRVILRTLTQRHELCMINENCTVNDRLQLLEDMNSQMKSIAAQLTQKCTEMNYYGCIDAQGGKIRNLARLNRQAGEIIAALDPANGYVPRGPFTQDDPHMLNRNAPAAGTPRKNSWWRELFSTRHYAPEEIAP